MCGECWSAALVHDLLYNVGSDVIDAPDGVLERAPVGQAIRGDSGSTGGAIERVIRVVVLILWIAAVVVGLAYLPEVAGRLGGLVFRFDFADAVSDFFSGVVSNVSKGLR